MVRILINLGIAMVLFTCGLGVSWYMMQNGLALQADEKAAAVESLTSKVPANVDAEHPESESTAELPVPVRSQPMTAEEIFRYGASIRGQHDALVKRQEEIDREEKRLQLIYEDIRGTRTELDGIQARVNDALTMAERLLAQLQAEWTDLEAQMTAATNVAGEQKNASPTAYAPGELENTKKFSTLIQEMPAESAAEYLKKLSDDGKIAAAAKLLDHIEDRDAAKILSAVDTELGVQLYEAMSNLPRPEAPKQRR